MKPITQILLTVSLLSLAACTKSGTEGVAPNPGKPQAGFVMGHVVDTQGHPIKGATIIANSANYYNDNNMGITDANGNYKIGLPNGPAVGAFYVRGNVKMSMEGKTYELPLFTQDDGTFMPDEGAVKNLQLKLSGPKTGNFGDTGLYGGSVEVYNHTNSYRTGDIEFTLEPIALIDGSQGETLTFHISGYTIPGIPIGKYKVSARHMPTNRALHVRILDSDTDYEPSFTTIFRSDYYIETIYKIQVDVTD